MRLIGTDVHTFSERIRAFRGYLKVIRHHCHDMSPSVVRHCRHDTTSSYGLTCNIDRQHVRNTCVQDVTPTGVTPCNNVVGVNSRSDARCLIEKLQIAKQVVQLVRE